ncbi:restriction endonuclease subunit S [Stenotrophomonas sp.]|uniref:restriction endonuclease subunit S n=1 Tax=Stenotrophomonas sp. TaxID=69392 RepID=UPI0028AF7DA5|nr:restriction endonuclease subunit S [Stenotrophomonas sp.]
MTALLTDNLPLLAIAPNGIKKLRELILELAMRGKLVPQDASDESAGELLLRIVEGKAGSVEKSAAKKNKPRGASADSAAPYQLPTGWQWSSLAQIAFVNPRNSASDNLEVSFVPMTLIGTRFDGQHGQEFRTWGDVKQGFTHFAEGDIGVAKITPCFENSKACVFAGLRNGLGAGTTELHIVRPVSGTLDARYVLAYLKSPQFLLAGETKMTGTAGQKRLPKEFVEANPFPLPPLGEQSRIVAKLDELMALCDRVEARQVDAEVAHMHLVRTLLDSLTKTVDAADFSASWQRLSDHFTTLFTTKASIDALIQTVLELAVMGKLAQQDFSDEPASVLLERIQRTRSSRGDKKPKLLAMSSGQEHPFELPRNWTWTTLPAVGELSRGKSRHRPRNDPSLYVGGSIPLVQTGDVARAHGIVRTHSAMYNAEGLAQSRLWPVGTMCITIAANIADSAILGFEACFPDSVVGFIPDLPELDVRYFEFFLRTAKSNLQNFAPSTAQKNINLEILGLLSVPLPPVNEMHRIVSKVDHVMALCDQLKASQTKARELSDALADAIVAAAIAEKPPASCSSAIYLSSYLVRKLASRPTFGRTAHMKWLFLADQHLGLELGMTYERQAAGPLDKLIYQVEEQAAQSQLYATQKETLKSGIEKIVYRPAAAIDRAADAGAAELGDKRAELDRLIGLLGGHKTEDLEIVATLYAVWNDALAEGQQPDDGWLINEFRTNWHKGKERFSPELLAKWLSWMREHRLVPVGKISSTRHQGSLVH